MNGGYSVIMCSVASVISSGSSSLWFHNQWFTTHFFQINVQTMNNKHIPANNPQLEPLQEILLSVLTNEHEHADLVEELIQRERPERDSVRKRKSLSRGGE